MIYVFILFSFFLATLLSGFLLPRILIVAYKKKLFDMPGGRKVHAGAVPRLGGISFMPALFITLFLVMALRVRLGFVSGGDQVALVVPEFCCLAAGITLLYLTGVRDDLIGLRYRAKFVAQFVTACFFPLSGVWINNLYGLFGIHELTPWIGIPFTILLTMFIVNAINLIDGIDGLASGLSMTALAVLGVLFLHYNLWIYSLLAFSMFGILLPFFYYNVFGRVERHEKIFMGDTGSLTLGYILAFLSIRYASVDPLLAPFSEGAIVVAFSALIVPMLDVLRVMYVRWSNKTGVFTADRNHIHHKFLDMGLSLRRTMISIIAMSAGFSIANIVLAPIIDNHILFFGDILVWVALNAWFNRIRNRRRLNLQT